MTTQTVELGVATFNPGGGRAADKRDDLDNLVAHGAHLIGGQEFGDQTRMVNAWLKANPNFAQLRFNELGAGRVPILYDTTVLLLDADWSMPVLEHEGGWVGPKGKGPTRIHPKALTRGTFTHLPTDRRVHHLNHHLVASHTRRDLSEREEKARREVALAQARVFRETLMKVNGVAFGTGDWNADPAWVAEQVPELLVDNTKPTHGRHLIDLVGHRKNPHVTPVSEQTFETSGSRKNHDHRSVLVKYAITVRPPEVCPTCGQVIPD